MLMVRLAGCKLGCSYCDQPDAQTGGTYLSVESLAQTIKSYNLPWLDISGGEPLLQAEGINLLLNELFLIGFYPWVEIETSGVYPPPVWADRVAKWVVDNKCPSSGISSKISNWTKVPCDVKFVVGTEQDLDFAKNNKVEGKVNLLSPVIFYVKNWGGSILISSKQARWNQRVSNFALEHDFRFSLQLHKIIWGMERQDK